MREKKSQHKRILAARRNPYGCECPHRGSRSEQEKQVPRKASKMPSGRNPRWYTGPSPARMLRQPPRWQSTIPRGCGGQNGQPFPVLFLEFSVRRGHRWSVLRSYQRRWARILCGIAEYAQQWGRESRVALRGLSGVHTAGLGHEVGGGRQVALLAIFWGATAVVPLVISEWAPLARKMP